MIIKQKYAIFGRHQVLSYSGVQCSRGSGVSLTLSQAQYPQSSKTREGICTYYMHRESVIIKKGIYSVYQP